MQMSPSFPPSKIVLCENCLVDYAIDIAYIKKNLNVFGEELVLLDELPLTAQATKKGKMVISFMRLLELYPLLGRPF